MWVKNLPTMHRLCDTVHVDFGTYLQLTSLLILCMHRQLHALKIRKIQIAKLIKQQISVSKTSQFKTDCKDDIDCVSQLKQQKSKRSYYVAAH